MAEIRSGGLRCRAVRWNRIVVALLVASAATTAGGALVAQTIAVDHGATVRQPARRVASPPAAVVVPELDQTIQVVELINIERARTGLPALVWHDQVAAAASTHSADMAATDAIGHTGSDGSDAGDRLTAEGFRWSAWGENVAAGFTTAEPLFDAWMASSGHRRQMLGEYTYIGIGVADAADGTAYWTLVVADA